MNNKFRINILNLSESAVRHSTFTLMQIAYRQEADLLKVPSLPPLEKSELQLAQEAGIFYGAYLDNELVGVLHFDNSNIDALVVNPKNQRQGVAGLLLNYVLQSHEGLITVSTAAQNFRAVQLYRKFGFTTKKKMTKENIELLTFER